MTVSINGYCHSIFYALMLTMKMMKLTQTMFSIALKLNRKKILVYVVVVRKKKFPICYDHVVIWYAKFVSATVAANAVEYS